MTADEIYLQFYCAALTGATFAALPKISPYNIALRAAKIADEAYAEYVKTYCRAELPGNRIQLKNK